MTGEGGVRHFFGFVKRCLAYLWVRHLVHNRYISGVADEKFDKVSARLSCQQNIVAELPKML